MKGVFNSTYIAAREGVEREGMVLLGCPLDATSSFRPGTRFAPDSIRKASWTLETYSPYFGHDLEDIAFRDAGNIELRHGDLPYCLELIEGAVTEALGGDRKVLIFGGEHLVTYPVFKAMKKRFGELQLVHFDAHCDLRDDYEGQRLSHATVMRRVKELGARLFQVGVRSGTRQEFEELNGFDSPRALVASLDRGAPVYVTFDMDVFDPSLAAGVTTPEPGGLTFKEAMAYLLALRGMNVVGADIVELCPDYDATFVSSVCASKVARELIMLLHS